MEGHGKCIWDNDVNIQDFRFEMKIETNIKVVLCWWIPRKFYGVHAVRTLRDLQGKVKARVIF